MAKKKNARLSTVPTLLQELVPDIAIVPHIKQAFGQFEIETMELS